MSIYMIMGGVLILGLILMIGSFGVAASIGACGSTTIATANRIVVVMATICVVSAISYMVCKTRCQCGDSEGLDLKIYMGLMMLVGVTLIVLGSIIHADSHDKKNANPEQCEKATKWAPVIWGTGVILFLISGGYLGFLVFQHGAKFIADNPELLAA